MIDRHEDSEAEASSREERILRWRPRMLAVWTVVGVFIAAWLVVGALGFVDQAIKLVLVGAVAGFICSPLTNRLENAHVPRGVAALISLVVLLLGLCALLAVVGGPLLEQFTVLLRNVPAYFEQAQKAFATFWATYGESADTDVKSAIESVLATLSSTGTSLASEAARQVSSGLMTNLADMAESFTTVFLGLVLAYWVTKDYPLMARELAKIVGPRHSRDVTLLLAVLSRSTGGYMYGTLITSVADGLMVAAGLAVVGHPYAGLLGALTFIMHFVPVIGPAISAILAVLLGLFVSPAVAIAALVVAMIAQNVADNVLSPLVMQRAVQIHPALSLVGIIVGGCIDGAVGMVLAIPLTAALRGTFVYFFETRTGRQVVSPDGALFRGTAYKAPDGSPLPELDALDDATFFEGSRLREALSAEDREIVEGRALDALFEDEVTEGEE
ncbi:AI-2E family transporter [Paratractidigestivibacter sp.]|uniref:AI-2E family transporter n=1 Tax=Paratractidigestivibacter sp. TaxID=2847316 RepID=UPI002ABE73D2|nr:AI-2E family transporter [Paratractidigestivibacter sp.]